MDTCKFRHFVLIMLFAVIPVLCLAQDDQPQQGSVLSTGSHMAVADISMKIGAATLDYPIGVPPGRNGLTPKVFLHYDSSQRNALAGVGWNLNTDAIRRSTRKGTCYSCTDFTYNGEQLVPVSVDANGYGTYRPEKERAFSTIRFLPDDSWSVTLKSGVSYRYGARADARQAGNQGTFKWYVSSIEDTNGNTISYFYTSEQGQIYPDTIEYSDYYIISFFYEPRTDIRQSHASHAGVTTAQRLKTIAIENHQDTIRAYDLTYTDSANTLRSLLTRITLYGSDFRLDADDVVIGGSSLPPTLVTYNQDLTVFTAAPEQIRGDLASDQGYSDTHSHPVITGDWNGDGRQDIGRAGDHYIEFYISTQTGFESLFSLYDLTAGQGYANNTDYPIITGDWNGDGRTDVGRVKDGGIYFYVATDTGFEGFAGLSDLAKNQGYTNQNEYPVAAGDFNADGKTDLARVHNSGIACYISTGTNWQSYSGLVTFGKTQGYPNNNEHPIMLGDFNGDGRTDIARVANTSIAVYVSTGSGFERYNDLPGFGKNQGFPNNNEYPVISGDFNADGLTDIGRAGDNHVLTYLSTGTGFVSGPQISNDLTKNYGCANYNTNPIFSGDFNDDGRTDIGRVKANTVVLYISTGSSFALYGTGITDLTPGQGFADNLKYPLVTGDFSGKGKTGVGRISASGVIFYSPDGKACDRMATITSTAGNTTQITYSPSSAYDNSLLPYVLQCVSQVVTDDGLGNTATTSYDYTGGLYDFEDRELRSFESVTKTNPDGTTRTTVLHQDRFLDGQPVRTELRDADDTLLSETDYTWETVAYGSQSVFIKLTAKRQTHYENGRKAYLQEDYTYYDAHGSLYTQTVSGTGLAENTTTTYEYDSYGTGAAYPLRTVRQTLAGSTSGITRQTDYTYETNTGNLLTQKALNTGGADPRVSYGYDTYGNVTAVTDARGHTTNIEYDTLVNTHAVRTQKPATGQFNHITSYPSVDYRFGKPLIFEDENNHQTTYAYDPFGRLTHVYYPDGGKETYDYDDTGLPRSVTKGVRDSDTTVIETIAYLDGFGRTIQSVSKSRQYYAVSLFTFDQMGRAACVKGPFFKSSNGFLSAVFAAVSSDPSTIGSGDTSTWTRNHYDARGRLVRVQQSGGIDTDLAYENLSTTVTGPDGRQKTETTDILGRILEVIEHGPADQFTTYTYNAAGDLLTVSRIDPATGDLIENTVAYNTLGQKTSMTDPDMGQWRYDYDLNGNLVSQTDAGNVTITFAYDELNRQTQKIYPDQSVARFEYDAAANGIGLFYQKSNAHATTEYTSYDAMGRLLSETRTIGATAVRFDYRYDPAGRQASKSVTLNHGLFKTLDYDFYSGTDLLKAVNDGSNQPYTRITEYSPQGKIEFMTHANGTETDYIYDYATGRLAATTSYHMDHDVQDKDYVYSLAGDVTEIKDNNTGISYGYQYDHLHRLISEQSSNGNAGVEVEIIEFTYADDGGAPVHAPVQTRKNGALTQYEYSATGNRLTQTDGSATTTYASDYDNKITRITQGGVQTNFYYDADSQRIKKTRGQSSTLYFGPDFEVINNIPTLYVFAGNLRVAKVTGTGLAYYHKDHLGSTNAISGPDGTIIDAAEYLPYGLDRSSNDLLQTSAYKFTDQELDAETGLYNYDARLYDPGIGGFISADWIVPGDGYDPQMLNRYSYVRNNPLIYVDPSGHHYGTDSPGGKADFGGETVSGNSIDNSDGRGGYGPFGDAGWGDYFDKSKSYSTDPKRAQRIVNERFAQRWMASHETAQDVMAIGGMVAFFFNPKTIFNIPRLIKRIPRLFGLKSVANPVPETLARVVPGKGPYPTLGLPGAEDVFVTAADDIAGLNALQISKRLTIPESAAFTVIKFKTPKSGLASPINRTNPGFIGGGRTAGGAREFVLPNQPVPSGAVVEIVP